MSTPRVAPIFGATSGFGAAVDPISRSFVAMPTRKRDQSLYRTGLTEKGYVGLRLRMPPHVHAELKSAQTIYEKARKGELDLAKSLRVFRAAGETQQ
jgi:hypothetical protein